MDGVRRPGRRRLQPAAQLAKVHLLELQHHLLTSWLCKKYVSASNWQSQLANSKFRFFAVVYYFSKLFLYLFRSLKMFCLLSAILCVWLYTTGHHW